MGRFGILGDVVGIGNCKVSLGKALDHEEAGRAHPALPLIDGRPVRLKEPFEVL